ncbi:MAG: hypothetical protein VB035_09470 [Candidatus Fimivivens sp.]|nr:hypothetical protein [Candidatus Fimivivens sp.]
MKELLNNIHSVDIIEAVKYIAILILGAASAYYQSNARLREISSKYIATAQVLYKDKEQRLDWVVNEIYGIVPTAIRPFLTKVRVKAIMQSAFDGSKAYREAWQKSLDQAVEEIPQPKPRGGPNARDY